MRGLAKALQIAGTWLVNLYKDIICKSYLSSEVITKWALDMRGVEPLEPWLTSQALRTCHAQCHSEYTMVIII